MSQTNALPREIALFPIRGCILPPGENLPLNVFEPRYLNMVDDAMAGSGHIAMVQPRPGGAPDKPALERIATAGRIVSHTETQDGRYLIVLTGVSRFAIAAELDRKTPYRVARADYAEFEGDLIAPAPAEGHRARLMGLMTGYFSHTGLTADWDALRAAPVNALVDRVAMAAPFSVEDKQALLAAPGGAPRAECLCALMEEALAKTRPAGHA
ncbi:peptidase S16 [Alkalicaulis satelles]|uniref:Peptidase S16 n=1 Tax=Alkalicaulis satelles TaxID=2609175 RepID=A0A5M6ZJR1_9PROT|nr:LON peptidase substrate-binding domain-containing protein [Alkalicaulis satelles]KAA5803917.1 peptidase S16 [Alkalicaulis satelles]